MQYDPDLPWCLLVSCYYNAVPFGYLLVTNKEKREISIRDVLCFHYVGRNILVPFENGYCYVRDELQYKYEHMSRKHKRVHTWIKFNIDFVFMAMLTEYGLRLFIHR